MELRFDELNWMAIAASALAIFMLGGIWYQPLFGKAWLAFQNFSPDEMESMKKAMPMPMFFGLMIVCYFVLSIAFALVIVGLDIRTAAGGASLGGLIGVGFVATTGYTEHISANKHVGVYYINTMYKLIFLMLSGIILAAWR